MQKKRDPGRLGEGGESKSSGTESATWEEEKGTQKDWERQTQRRKGRHSERDTRIETGRYGKLLSRY